MPVKSLLVSLLVPPANLVLVCAAGLVLERYRPRGGRTIVTLGICALFILAMPVSGTLLLTTLEDDLPLIPSGADPPGAIVILTGDEGHGEGDVPQIASVGPLSLERLRAGAALYRRVRLPILVTGGSLHPGEEPLSAILARSLVEDFGVPVRWLETRSHTTWRSAEATAAMLGPAGIKSVYLVTHGWHMRRSLIAFRHFGITATAVPVRIDRLGSWSLSAFIPTTRAWLWSYDGLHEWIGCAYYALR